MPSWRKDCTTIGAADQQHRAILSIDDAIRGLDIIGELRKRILHADDVEFPSPRFPWKTTTEVSGRIQGELEYNRGLFMLCSSIVREDSPPSLLA